LRLELVKGPLGICVTLKGIWYYLEQAPTKPGAKSLLSQPINTEVQRDPCYALTRHL
jgi:hypothetical protein